MALSQDNHVVQAFSAKLSRNVRHDCDGGPIRLIMYLETVASETLIPSFNSSPCVRGAPHSRLALHMRLWQVGRYPERIATLAICATR